jgi:molybdopterin converting factor subunit 1
VKINVLLFATARQAAGTDRLELELPANATIADAKRALAEQFPSLAPRLPSCAIAIELEIAKETQPLHAGCELAVLPPVSGG